MSKVSEGTIILVDADSQPVESFDGWVNIISDEADEIGETVNSIENCVSTIESLFDAIHQKLEEIIEQHIDDNAADLARVLQRKFGQAKDNFYWEVCETDNNRDWKDMSLMMALHQIVRNEKQTLLFPELRRTWEEVTKNDKPAATEKEREDFVEHFKRQFYLHSNTE